MRKKRTNVFISHNIRVRNKQTWYYFPAFVASNNWFRHFFHHIWKGTTKFVINSHYVDSMFIRNVITKLHINLMEQTIMPLFPTISLQKQTYLPSASLIRVRRKTKCVMRRTTSVTGTMKCVISHHNIWES